MQTLWLSLTFALLLGSQATAQADNEIDPQARVAQSLQSRIPDHVSQPAGPPPDIFTYEGVLVPGRQYLIEADPDAGFHWPYFLTVPPLVRVNAPILIEPNNDGRWGPPFATHEYWAGIVNEQLYLRFGRELETAALTPVFPRPLVGDGDGNLYIHALTRAVMVIEEERFARPDLQLLAMLDDARSKLSLEGYSPSEDAILWGFSAASDFVTRMAVLHPNRVRAVAAGGLGGFPILPVESLGSSTLTYPVGVGDFRAITGHELDAAKLRSTPLLLFQGGADFNDSVPEPPLDCNNYWSDSYDCIQASFINSRFGAAPIERVEGVRSVYAEFGMEDFNYVILPDIDHWTPRAWNPVMLEFFQCVIDQNRACAAKIEAPDLTADVVEQANRPPR
jgi:pimeloyl-ACP methyl ester carboxylesterase